MVERLIASRLVVSAENERGEGTVEIVHEALVSAWPRLAEWRREDAENSRFHAQLRVAAKQWADRGRPRGLLWRGDALAEYQLWHKRNVSAVTTAEAEFGAASVADAARGRRIRNALAAIALLAVIVFIIGLVVANRATRRSERAAQQLLVDATVDRGRLLMLQGEKSKALEPLATAYQMGDTGPAVRFMIEEALRTTRPKSAVLTAHSDKVFAVAFSPDGARLATAGNDGAVIEWNTATNAPIRSLKTGSTTYALAYSPNGQLLASGELDHRVDVWSLASEQPVAAIDTGAGTRVYDLAFSADGSQLLASGRGVGVWNVGDGALAAKLVDHGVAGGAFCASGQCIVTWQAEGVVTWWDAHTFAKLARVEIGSNLQVAAASPSGDRVAFADESGEVVLVSSEGRVVARYPAHEGKTINVVVFSHDGKHFATGGDDNAVWLWDVATNKPIATLQAHHAGIWAEAFSPRDDTLASASVDGGVRLWSVPSGLSTGELNGHTDRIAHMKFSPDGRTLATASWDHRVVEWNLAKASHYREIPAEREGVIAVGTDRVAFGTADGSLELHDLGAPGSPPCRLAGNGAILTRVAWEPGGNRIVVAGIAEREARVWNAATCQLIATIPSAASVAAVAFGERERAAIGGDDGTWSVTDLSAGNGARPRALPRLRAGIVRLGFVTADRVFARTTDSRAAVVLQGLGADAAPLPLSGEGAVAMDVAAMGTPAACSRSPAISVSGHGPPQMARLSVTPTPPTRWIILSPDGRFLIGIGAVSLPVWDAASLRRVSVLEGHTNMVSSAGFIAGGLLVTASVDSSARVWDLDTFHALEIADDATLVGSGPIEIRGIPKLQRDHDWHPIGAGS